jgi:hypothetical protein
LASQASSGRLRGRSAGRPRAHDGRAGGLRPATPGAVPLLRHVGVAAGVRGRVRYGCMTRHPAKLAGAKPMPAPWVVRVYTSKELQRIAKELDKRGAAAITFAAATGYGRLIGRTSNTATSTASGAFSPCAAPKRGARGASCAYLGGDRRARRNAEGADSLAVRVRSAEGRTVRPRELPASGVGGRRSSPQESRPLPARTTYVRRSQATHLPPESPSMSRSDHGNERRDDRAALRGFDRYRSRVVTRALGGNPMNALTEVAVSTGSLAWAPQEKIGCPR